MNITKTARGFAFGEFTDLYGEKCSIQKSSLAEIDAIWIGIDKPVPMLLHGDARRLGLGNGETSGWVKYPLPECVELAGRMHLTREQVAELLPVLQCFVETGDLPDCPLKEGT